MKHAGKAANSEVAEHLSKEVLEDAGRGVGAHAGVVKTFLVFGGFKGLVELYHVGVAAAELVVRAVAADDDVHGV